MKFLFKIIVIPILSIIAIPAILLALTYKDVQVPVEDFQSVGAISLTDMITEQIDSFLSTPDSTATLGLDFTQAQADGLLLSSFLSINPNYLDTNAPADEQNYVMKEPMYGYQGSWVTFTDDTVTITSGVHAFVQGFTYKTAVIIAFKLQADTDQVVLKLDKLNIGSLPLAWTFGVANWAVEQITGNSVQSIIDDALGGSATFDPEQRSITFDVQELVQSQITDPQSAALVNSLMAFIASNDLLSVGFTDGEFSAALALGKMRDDSTPFMLTEAQKIQNDIELQTILQSQASSLILSTLTTTDYPYVEFNALTLNRMFEYFMRPSLAGDGIIHQVDLFEHYRMTAYVPYFTMDDNLVVNIPMRIEDTNDPLKFFPTIIKITATPEIDGSDLKIVLNELNAGEVTLTQEHITNILSLLGSSDLLVDGAFVISDFASQMDQAGLSLQSTEVVGNKLRMYVALNDTIPLADIQNAVSDVLDAVANNPAYTPELNTAINDVITNIDNPADAQAAVDDLLAVIDTLPDSEQEALFQDLVDAFAGTGLTYDEIAGLLP